ncbi:hemicentin-1-like isoform X2 [Polypterus senegalus]|uniref:hemicentin-1-like isoform X2 n=1 Tax=Polypterus senegalus TaxID=55291 RepID=UPI0019639801|nr:hemicentin-1-like isoform X2 [Polypterus senegalus]XP_039623379.1 hemicentin-1-like isoform X2 [Polypterus senegalus]
MREDKMDSRWGLCWALLFVPALHCTGFSVSQPQGQMEAEESSNVTLVCVMSSETPLGPARWYKCAGSERTHFYSGAPKGGDKIDPRVTWTVNNTLLNYSITIRDLRINDTGEYYCEKYTKGENENKPYASGPGVKLTVKGFPVIHGPTSRVQVGATVNLSCEAAGSSATEIEWKKNDSKLTSNTESSLVSLVVNKSDIKSVIECQVSGFPKLSTTYSMNSIIMVFPEMTISGEPSLVLGQSATFNCSVSGFYPSAFNVSWVINNNSMMHEGANVKENDDGTFTESKTITLTATEEYHHRQLICQASHEGFEKVQKSVILSVRAHPTITGKPHRVESERNLTLICDSKGDKNTTITWQKNGAHIAEGHTETWENGSRNILVMKIEKEDLGSWISCQIPGYGRDKVLSAHLNISDFLIVHPNVTIHENPKLILGQVANFTCWIREFYPRNISLLWSNGSTSMESSDEVMENEDGTFTARSCITFNVREEHRGNQLKCQATFQGSESVESTVTLGVRAQPVITGHLQRIKEGDKVTLSCTSKGDTDTDVTWLKNENLQVRGRSEAWSDGSNSSFTWTFGMPNITSNISCLIPGYERDKMSHTVNISDYIIVLPNVVIKKEVLSQNNQFTRVTCFVEQFYPQNISMELLWESPSEKFYRNETHKNADGTFSTSASLEIEVGEAAIPVSCRTRYQGMNLSSLTINVTDERHHDDPHDDLFYHPGCCPHRYPRLSWTCDATFYQESTQKEHVW